MKIALLCINGFRSLLWALLIPWLGLMAMLVIAVLKSSTSPITEAAGAAVGCFGIIAAYCAVRSVDGICERIEASLREWFAREETHGS